MKLKTVACVALFLFAVGPAQSQIGGDTCLKLAETITAGVRKSYTERQYDAMRHYANCASAENSANAALDIGYKVFTLGAKYSQDKKKATCTKEITELNILATDYNETKIIFDQTLKTIDHCLSLAGRSWIINAAFIQADAISLSIANTSGLGGRIDAIDLLPKKSITCEGMPKKFPVIVKADGLTLTCQRDSVTQIVDGIVLSSSKDATINLRLAEQPFPLTIPGYSDSPIREIAERLGKIEGDMVKFRNGLGDWSGAAETAGNQVGGGVAMAPTICPKGQYAVGFKWWGAPGSTRYCIGCGSGFQIVCRKLNAG